MGPKMYSIASRILDSDHIVAANEISLVMIYFQFDRSVLT